MWWLWLLISLGMLIGIGCLGYCAYIALKVDNKQVSHKDEKKE